MIKEKNSSLEKSLFTLKMGEIIAYPTESVFALGCDPDNEIAIKKLLSIKKRSWKKGLILITGNYKQIIPYINKNQIEKLKKKFF